MTTIKILNGINTIGGNVVSFIKNDTKILMDFGINFSPDKKSNAELLDDGSLPQLPDLFTDADQEYKNTVIFISHLHIDHMGALKFLTKPIDVYMTPESLALYLSLIELGVEQSTKANLKIIEYETPIRVGDFKVTAYASDHDIVGASLLEVFDGQHRFVHSGDFRYDGPNKERVDQWSKKLNDKKVDLFFIEGTEFSFISEEDINKSSERIRNTEFTLQAKFAEYMQTNKKVIVINPYERNVERLINLQITASKNNRKLIWNHRFAEILRSFNVSDILEIQKDISWQEILLNPELYVVQNSFDDLRDLSILDDDFIYLHMNGEPLGDYDPRFKQLKEFLDSKHVELIFMGASGHAKAEDLIQVAKLVNAKQTVPWHSFKPELEAEALKKAGLEVLELKKGDEITF